MVVTNRKKKKKRGPAEPLFHQPPHPPCENQRPPVHSAAPQSPRLHRFATSPPIFAREIAAPFPGDRASVRDSPPGQVSPDACALSSRPPPRTVRLEENSAAPDRRRGPIPHSSFPELCVAPGQGMDTPRGLEVCGAGAPAPVPTAVPMPH